jgi:hypothetical protein
MMDLMKALLNRRRATKGPVSHMTAYPQAIVVELSCETPHQRSRSEEDLSRLGQSVYSDGFIGRVPCPGLPDRTRLRGYC